MTDLIVALGLVFVIEGLIWAIFPGYAKTLLEAVSKIHDSPIRATAVCSVAFGVLLVWLGRG